MSALEIVDWAALMLGRGVLVLALLIVLIDLVGAIWRAFGHRS